MYSVISCKWFVISVSSIIIECIVLYYIVMWSLKKLLYVFIVIIYKFKVIIY